MTWLGQHPGLRRQPQVGVELIVGPKRDLHVPRELLARPASTPFSDVRRHRGRGPNRLIAQTRYAPPSRDGECLDHAQRVLAGEMPHAKLREVLHARTLARTRTRAAPFPRTRNRCVVRKPIDLAQAREQPLEPSRRLDPFTPLTLSRTRERPNLSRGPSRRETSHAPSFVHALTQFGPFTPHASPPTAPAPSGTSPHNALSTPE